MLETLTEAAKKVEHILKVSSPACLRFCCSVRCVLKAGLPLTASAGQSHCAEWLWDVWSTGVPHGGESRPDV